MLWTTLPDQQPTVGAHWIRLLYYVIGPQAYAIDATSRATTQVTQHWLWNLKDPCPVRCICSAELQVNKGWPDTNLDNH